MLGGICCMPLMAQQRQMLNEGWTFGQARQPNRYPAQVPGVVHTDLMRHGLISDPYVALNERSVQWVDKEDWVYETTFQTDLTNGKSIDLCFDGLDTYADVYLNDSLVIKADNMFRRWRTNVSSILRKGDNKLRVYLHSPIKVDMPKWEKTPGVYRGAIQLKNSNNSKTQTLGSIPVEIRVLDFALPAPKCYGDDEQDFYVASYEYNGIAMLMEQNGGDYELGVKQLQAQLENHVSHNQNFNWIRQGICAESRRTIEAMRAAGMQTDVILGGLGCRLATEAEMKAAAERQMKAAREIYGGREFYIGYGDELETVKVGTIGEVNSALSMTIDRWYAASPLPCLLKDYRPQPPSTPLQSLFPEHNLTPSELDILKQCIENHN